MTGMAVFRHPGMQKQGVLADEGIREALLGLVRPTLAHKRLSNPCRDYGSDFSAQLPHPLTQQRTRRRLALRTQILRSLPGRNDNLQGLQYLETIKDHCYR